MNTSTIKPDKCPFCGYTASIETFKVRKGYEANVHCNNCLANIPTITFDTEDEAYYQAVTDWNTRTTTVDAESVKHGKWIVKPHKMMGECPCCSACGSFNPIEYRYCPNCGADMRGEQDDSISD